MDENEKKIERSELSVDEILDEYWARVAAESRGAQDRDYGLTDDYDSVDEDESLPAEVEDAGADLDDDGVRIYRPGAPAAGWNGEKDFQVVYEKEALGAEAEEDEWYDEDEEDEVYRPMSARDILKEYWQNNAPAYIADEEILAREAEKAEAEVQAAEDTEAAAEELEAVDAPAAEAEGDADEAFEDEDVLVYETMSARDILKEYWQDNADEYIAEPEEEAAAPEGERAEPVSEAAPTAPEETNGSEAPAPEAEAGEVVPLEMEEKATAPAEAPIPHEAEEEVLDADFSVKDILAEYWMQGTDLPPVEESKAETPVSAPLAMADEAPVTEETAEETPVVEEDRIIEEAPAAAEAVEATPESEEAVPVPEPEPVEDWIHIGRPRKETPVVSAEADDAEDEAEVTASHVSLLAQLSALFGGKRVVREEAEAEAADENEDDPDAEAAASEAEDAGEELAAPETADEAEEIAEEAAAPESEGAASEEIESANEPVEAEGAPEAGADAEEVLSPEGKPALEDFLEYDSLDDYREDDLLDEEEEAERAAASNPLLAELIESFRSRREEEAQEEAFEAEEPEEADEPEASIETEVPIEAKEAPETQGEHGGVSFEELDGMLSAAMETPAPLEEPAPVEAESAVEETSGDTYVYAQEPEPTVREILTEYWTSGESEPIQDAQIRAEQEAEDAYYEDAAHSGETAEDEPETVYQPAPVLPQEEGAEVAQRPSVEDYQHTAEDLGLTVENILAEYWADDAARKAARSERVPYEPEKPAEEPKAGRRVRARRRAQEQEAQQTELDLTALFGPSAEETNRAAEEALAQEQARHSEEDLDAMAALFSAGSGAAAAATGAAAATVAATAAAGTALASAAVGKGKSGVSAMADEARRFIDELNDSGYAGLGDEASYNNKAKGASWNSDPVDPRFDLGGRGRKSGRMTFGGQEVDLSADEDYVPPAAASGRTQWTGGDDAGKMKENGSGFLASLKRWGRGKLGVKDTEAVEEQAAEDMPAAEEPILPADETPTGDLPTAEIPAQEDLPAEEEPGTVEPGTPAWEDLEKAADYFRKAETADPADYGMESGEITEAAGEAILAGELPGKRRKKRFARASSHLEDTDAMPAAYAADRDYGENDLGDIDPEDLDDIQLEGEDNFPSFGQWILGNITGLLIRLRGVGDNNSADTMEMDDEELGPEMPVANASKYYGAYLRTLRLRFSIGLVLLALMAWISLGLPVAGMLKTARVAAALLLGMQLTVMLLNLDVLTNAAINLARGRFGADSLAGLCCVLTSFDALAVALNGFGHSHTPFCLLSSLSLMGVMYASLLSTRGLRKSLRVPAIGRRCYSVTGEKKVRGNRDLTLLKSARPLTGFVRRSEEAPPDESFFAKLAPFLLLLALLFTVVIVLAKHSASDFLYVLTALLCPAVPVTALLAYALPYCTGAMRLFSSGAAVAGWSGICDLGRSQNLIVTDRDLFPEGSVELESVRIFADVPAEKIISYAGTMVTAAGSGISSCFGELMQKNGGSMRHVENFEYLAGGGMKGIINGETVLCGSTDLMRLMNVRIPYRLVSRTSVLLAVDGVLYGIFNMKYNALPQVREALVGLIRSSRHPIFAIRDFNIGPDTLHSIFDVATDGYDFPPFVERFAISEAKPAGESKIAAVLCREGLGPLVDLADSGRSMYIATRINLLVTIIAAVASLVISFVTLLTASTVSVGFLLLLMLVWLLPVAVVSLLIKR